MTKTESALEELAKAIHDKSEADQARHFNKKKVINYVIMPWADVKPGFYKDHIYTLANKYLAAKDKPPLSGRKKERLKVQSKKRIETSKKKVVKKKVTPKNIKAR